MKDEIIFAEEINDGYVEKPIEETAYIYGSSPVPDFIVKPTGQWDDPFDDETQIKGFETSGCSIFNSTNQIELQEAGQYGTRPNYSDRAGYIMANISPPGADPHYVLDIIRKQGLLQEADLPWSDSIQTLQQYASPKPLPKELIEKALKWLDQYVFRHEYLPQGAKGFVEPEVMKECLKRSVL